MINDYLKEKNITIKEISNKANIPYSTLREMISGKSSFERCSISNFKKIADYFNISMDELYYLWNHIISPTDIVEKVKSELIMLYHNMPLTEFIKKIEGDKVIQSSFKKKEYLKALYILSFYEFICNKYKLDKDKSLEKLHNFSLEHPYYPESVISVSKAFNDDRILQEYKAKSIPEFLKHNIIEYNIEI